MAVMMIHASTNARVCTRELSDTVDESKVNTSKWTLHGRGER